MHQLASPPMDRQVRRAIEDDALEQQSRLAAVPVPREPRRNRWVLWVLLLLTLVVLGVIGALILSR